MVPSTFKSFSPEKSAGNIACVACLMHTIITHPMACLWLFPPRVVPLSCFMMWHFGKVESQICCSHFFCFGNALFAKEKYLVLQAFSLAKNLV